MRHLTAPTASIVTLTVMAEVADVRDSHRETADQLRSWDMQLADARFISEG